MGSGYSLQLIHHIIADTPVDDRRRRWLMELRRSILNDEGEFQERLRAIQQEAVRIHAEMEEQIEKLTAPANRIGTLLGLPKEDIARVIVGGSEYYANIDPELKASNLKKGVQHPVERRFCRCRRTRIQRRGTYCEDSRCHARWTAPYRARTERANGYS